MKSWASEAGPGASRRQSLLRSALALLMLGALLWALPSRKAGEGDHHAAHQPVLDAYERAGIVELREGQHGPTFALRSLDGGSTTLAELTRNHLVVLNFWATWCQPCTLEMPTLEALWRDYRNRGLSVAAVSVDRGAPRDLLVPYVRGLDLSFPILLDPDAKTAGAWRVNGLPATFVIKPGGEVAGFAMGAREWNSAEMRALLESLLPARPGLSKE